VLYAKKDYEAALRQFQDVAERFPSSRKLPDSLLKIGMCHRRMGDTERARVYFRRVLRQYPDSNAARIASREDAS
jgi:TolA-binding protein